MKTVEVKIYKIGELSDEAKARARDDFRSDQDLSHVWEHIEEDAKNVGLVIEELDARINRGRFEESADQTAGLIIKNHGKDCDTHKLAVEWRGTEMSDDEFLRRLLSEYWWMYQRDLEFEQSDEEVNASLEERLFLGDGTLWTGPESSANEDLDSLIQDWAEDHGSAVDVWMDYDQRSRLRSLIHSGARIKTKTFGSYLEASSWRDKQECKGWTLLFGQLDLFGQLATEDNIDLVEVVLYKEKK